MKAKFIKIISIILCCISLISAAGCVSNNEQKENNGDNPPNTSKGLRITLNDSDNNILYNDKTLQPETLSLDEVYYLTVQITTGAAFIPYDALNIKYNAEYVEVLALTDQYEGEVYSLRGLTACNNCIIKFYSIRYYLDENGNITTDGEIYRYSSIVVNFS